MLCDNQTKAETLLQNCEKGQTPTLKTVILMDSFSDELIERGVKCGVDIMSLQDIEVMQAKCEVVDDVISCLYTHLGISVNDQDL